MSAPEIPHGSTANPAMPTPRRAPPTFTIFAVVGLFLAVTAYFNFFGHGISGVVAVIALLCGLIGCIELIRPNKTGGVVMVITLLLALATIAVAVLRLSGFAYRGPPGNS